MKKIAFFLSLLLLVLASCNGDDNNDTVNDAFNPETANITGKWYLSKTKDSDETEWQDVVHSGPCERDYTVFTNSEMINYYEYYFEEECHGGSDTQPFTRNGRFLTGESTEINSSTVIELININSEMMHLKATFQFEDIVDSTEAIFTKQ